MRLTLKIGRHEYTITTDHSASSYGIPVVLRDGELSDIIAEYEADEPDMPTALDLLADAAHVWGGPATRRALADYAAAHLPEDPTGADYDRILGEFVAEGQRRRAAELAAELAD